MRLHRLDVVDAAARAPTRLMRESRSFRDGAIPTQENSDGLTPAEVAYIELQSESSKDAAALQRCHELLA